MAKAEILARYTLSHLTNMFTCELAGVELKVKLAGTNAILQYMYLYLYLSRR